MNTKDIKKSNKTRKVPSLKDYCKKNINNYDFERLHEIANVSKHSVTKGFNNPIEMKYPLLLAICNLLNEKAIYLIDTYNCGLNGITAAEYRSLLSRDSDTTYTTK